METIFNIINDNIIIITTAILAALTVGPYLWFLEKRNESVRKKISEAKEFGLHEPVSLHPKINRDICIGSGACITSCPEKEIIGLVAGKGEAVFASRCIGLGACERACPVGAIELVFGTEKRGVDIPAVNEELETNVKGIFIAGELGGMGLIQNALMQGMKAVDFIVQRLKEDNFQADENVHDLIIIGAGPAGLASSLQATKDKIKYLAIDQEEKLGGTILSYPRAKVVMTAPVKMPLYGNVRKKIMSKEELLELWDKIVDKTKIKFEINEKLISAKRSDDKFIVNTSKRELHCRYLLLCIGRRGTPRKLGVPGEGTAKVMYRLLEPEHFEKQKVLVVGGGDSAVEAAVALSAQTGTKVTLSYRKDAFSRIKQGNKEALGIALKAKKIQTMMSSNVIEIKEDKVLISHEEQTKEIPNDSVFIFAGGEMPTPFLKKLGVSVETKFNTR